jgi:DNA topoisomerase-1
MRTLIIVESPAKAATIQKYVGKDYIVEATLGHVVDLGKGGNKGIGIDVNNNFKPYYVILKDKVALLDNLIQEAEKSDEILIATDPDREGEAMAFHLQNRLETTRKPISRVEFREISKAGVHAGIANRRAVNINLFRSQEARRILDRIVGFMVSPYLINYYGPHLSAGRVQSVAVRIIADREKEIETFNPEEFWNVFGKFKNQANEEFTAKYQGLSPYGRPCDKERTDIIVNLLKKQEEFYVSAVTRQKKKEKPCPPMTTAALQQYMAKKYSFEPDRTMKAAQNLYENGFCTYIRTDSTRISNEALKPVRDWIMEHSFEIPKKPNMYATKDSAQDAHECIRPTNVKTHPDESILSGDEKEVYRVIWQHFIACQMNPAIWNTLSVNIRARMNTKLTFVVSGKALDYKGYLEIFGPVDPGKIDIPNLTEGDILRLSGDDAIKTEQKFTQPPPRFNDASIIKELEGRQIGRPATYAEIIKKISNRHYVEKSGSTYRPTDLGKKITNILVELFPFMEYEYTANMEKQLDEIAVGNINSISMLKEFFVPFKEKLDLAYKNSGGIICDKCGSPMIVRTNSKDQTKFVACSSFPKCRNTKPFEESKN